MNLRYSHAKVSSFVICTVFFRGTQKLKSSFELNSEHIGDI